MHRQPWFGVPLQLSSLAGSQVSAAAGLMLQALQVPSTVQNSVPAAHGPSAPPSRHERLSPGLHFPNALDCPAEPEAPDSLSSLNAPACPATPPVPACVSSALLAPACP